MKITRKEIKVVSLSIASVLLMIGVGYSMVQSSPSSGELNGYQDGTPTNRAGLVVREIPMDVIPGEGTPPGEPVPGETPVPTPGATRVPTEVPTASPTTP
jgi:hypothetical protein